MIQTEVSNVLKKNPQKTKNQPTKQKKPTAPKTPTQPKSSKFKLEA